MIDRTVSNKQPPTLEQRIKVALDNQIGSEALIELIRDTEAAAQDMDQAITTERARLLDIAQCSDPAEARERIATLETSRDRLRHMIPRLKEKLSTVLASEACDKWQAACNKVKAEQEALLDEYADVHQAYRSAKAKRDDLIRRMEDCDLDCERVNDAARELDIWDRQLEPLLQPVQPERTWGPPRISNGGLAVACAQSMVPPTYYPADWSKPEVQAQRRAEAEKSQREMGAYYEQAGKDQETRQNAEERERFQQHRTP